MIDKKSLKYFMTTKKLLRWQTCWAEFLSRFNFDISYTPDRKYGKVDLLTHQPNNNLAND